MFFLSKTRTGVTFFYLSLQIDRYVFCLFYFMCQELFFHLSKCAQLSNHLLSCLNFWILLPQKVLVISLSFCLCWLFSYMVLHFLEYGLWLTGKWYFSLVVLTELWIQPNGYYWLSMQNIFFSMILFNDISTIGMSF